MRLFEELQARFTAPRYIDPRPSCTRFDSFSRLQADPDRELERILARDNEFQEGMDTSLQETIDATLAEISSRKER